jgi:hypothetical protein
MFTYSIEEYMLIAHKCRNGEISQEQAIIEINKKYKKTLKYIKQEMTKIMEESGFYRFVSGGIDELISIYDKTVYNKIESEREYYENIYSKIIEDFLSDTKKQADEQGVSGKLDFDHARRAIIEERDKIAEICNTQRDIKEQYEKFVREIANIETDISNYEKHYFMIILKMDSNQAFKVMKTAIQKGLVEFKDNYFNFKCDKGCVGLIFAEAGYTDYKRISQHILIHGEKCELITLQNAKKNTPPKEWDSLSKILFGTII